MDLQLVAKLYGMHAYHFNPMESTGLIAHVWSPPMGTAIAVQPEAHTSSWLTDCVYVAGLIEPWAMGGMSRMQLLTIPY